MFIEKSHSKYVSKDAKILDWGGDIGINKPFRGISPHIYVYHISDK